MVNSPAFILFSFPVLWTQSNKVRFKSLKMNYSQVCALEVLRLGTISKISDILGSANVSALLLAKLLGDAVLHSVQPLLGRTSSHVCVAFTDI